MNVRLFFLFCQCFFFYFNFFFYSEELLPRLGEELLKISVEKGRCDARMLRAWRQAPDDLQLRAREGPR